jgi:hypothetical protein
MKKSALKNLIKEVIKESWFSSKSKQPQSSGNDTFDKILAMFRQGKRYLTISQSGSEYNFYMTNDSKSVLNKIGMHPHLTIEMKNVTGNVSDKMSLK